MAGWDLWRRERGRLDSQRAPSLLQLRVLRLGLLQDGMSGSALLSRQTRVVWRPDCPAQGTALPYPGRSMEVINEQNFGGGLVVLRIKQEAAVRGNAEACRRCARDSAENPGLTPRMAYESDERTSLVITRS